MTERICKAEAVRRYGRKRIDPVSGHILEKAAARGWIRKEVEGTGGRRRVYFYAHDIEEWIARFDNPNWDNHPWIPSWWDEERISAHKRRFWAWYELPQPGPVPSAFCA